MFKMGCSMARKILAPGSGSSSNEQTGAGSAAAIKGDASADKNGRQANKSADELGDFSKLDEDPRLPLNVRQIFKITKSWKAIARTMSKTGTAMFLNLFEQNQDLFYLFDRFQHLKGKELHESMELREHAATVMATLDQSINSLSDYDNFVSYLHSIGELHRKVPGFKRDYFWKIEQPFMKAVKQTLDERCNETIEQIYVIAIKLIIETIAEGYGQDDDSAGADSEAKKAGGGGGGGGGGAGNQWQDPPAAREHKVGGGRDAGGAGQKGGAQQHRTSGNENNRARQHACPLSREHKQISENKSISAQGRAANETEAASSEHEASLVAATCALMSSTGNWLSNAGRAHEASRVQWERLMNGLGANGGLLEASEAGAECKERDEDQLALLIRSNRADRLKPDGRKRAADTTARSAASQSHQETTACPRIPATQHKSSAAKLEARQTIISSCPVQRASSNDPRLQSAQRGACEVQGLNGLRQGAQDNFAPTGSCVGRPPGDIESQQAAEVEHQADLAMMNSCNNNNELARSQVTGAPGSARVTLQPEVPGGRPESVDLIKSARRRAQLNGLSKLTRLLAGRPKSARSPSSPKPTSNQNQSRLHCARQSRNNNKLQITPPLPTAASAAEIRLEATSRVGEYKQGEWPAASAIADDRPPGREHFGVGPAAKVGAVLHKSEEAALKLLASARRDTQLAELIKVLLLINRLLLTLASRQPRQSRASNTTEVSAKCPLFAAS